MRFMPALKELLDDLNIMVVYAQEYITDEDKALSKETYQHGTSEENASHFWTTAKKNAIAAEVEKHMKKFDASWKNLLSFGDSNFERQATITAASEYVKKHTGAGEIDEFEALT